MDYYGESIVVGVGLVLGVDVVIVLAQDPVHLVVVLLVEHAHRAKQQTLVLDLFILLVQKVDVRYVLSDLVPVRVPYGLLLGGKDVLQLLSHEAHRKGPDPVDPDLLDDLVEDLLAVLVPELEDRVEYQDLLDQMEEVQRRLLSLGGVDQGHVGDHVQIEQDVYNDLLLDFLVLEPVLVGGEGELVHDVLQILVGVGALRALRDDVLIIDQHLQLEVHLLILDLILDRVVLVVVYLLVVVFQQVLDFLGPVLNEDRVLHLLVVHAQLLVERL